MHITTIYWITIMARQTELNHAHTKRNINLLMALRIRIRLYLPNTCIDHTFKPLTQ